MLIEKHRAYPLLRTRDGDSAWLVAGQWAHLDKEGGQQRDNRAVFYAMEPRVVREACLGVIRLAIDRHAQTLIDSHTTHKPQDEIEDEVLAAELALEDGEGDAAALYATGFLQSECASPSLQPAGAAGPSKRKKKKKKKKGGGAGAEAGGGGGEEGEEMEVEGREAFEKGGEEKMGLTEEDKEALAEAWELISEPFLPLPPPAGPGDEAERRAQLMEELAADPEVKGDKQLLHFRVDTMLELERVRGGGLVARLMD